MSIVERREEKRKRFRVWMGARNTFDFVITGKANFYLGSLTDKAVNIFFSMVIVIDDKNDSLQVISKSVVVAV